MQPRGGNGYLTINNKGWGPKDQCVFVKTVQALDLDSRFGGIGMRRC